MHCWLHIAKLHVRSFFQHRMQEDSPTTMRMPLPTRELAPRGRVVVGDGAEPENCPICLSSLSFAVDTNCGHTFCARCILSYWEHDQWPRAARCPVCRNGVICEHYKWNDFEIFTVTGVPVAPSCCTIQLNQPRALEHGPQLQSANVWPAKICQLHCATLVYRISSLSLQLVQYLSDIPLILGHLLRLTFTADGIALLYRLHILLLLLLLVLYLFSPLDLIPEAVFGAVGLLDDIIILIAVAAYASQLYRHYVTNG